MAPEASEAPSKSKSPAKAKRSQPRFQYADCLAVNALLQTIGSTLEFMVLDHKARKKEKDWTGAIDMAHLFSKCKTLKSLMREMSAHVNDYLDFTDISILFLDPEKKQLYTITQSNEDERRAALEWKLRHAGSDEEREDIKALEELQDFVLEASSMIFFPTDTGLSSKVFNGISDTIAINDFSKTRQHEFVGVVDNPKDITRIQNYMIGSLRNLDGEANGVMQLFNSARGFIT